MFSAERTTLIPFYKFTGRFKSELGLFFEPEEQGNVFLRTTYRYNPEDLALHSHRCESLKSYLFIVLSYNRINLDSDFIRELGQLIRYSEGLGGQSSIPGMATFSLPRSYQTGFWAHPTSYPMGTRAISRG
jgi:hypothetical protein